MQSQSQHFVATLIEPAGETPPLSTLMRNITSAQDPAAAWRQSLDFFNRPPLSQRISNILYVHAPSSDLTQILPSLFLFLSCCVYPLCKSTRRSLLTHSMKVSTPANLAWSTARSPSSIWSLILLFWIRKFVSLTTSAHSSNCLSPGWWLLVLWAFYTTTNWAIDLSYSP